MPGNTCNGSKAIMLANTLNKTAPLNLTLRLFINNITPADADNVNASGYQEANFSGYGGIALTAGTWSITVVDPSAATYPQQTFVSTTATPQTCYGYYITRADGSLYTAERFSDGPYSISNATLPIKVTPTVSLTD